MMWGVAGSCSCETESGSEWPCCASRQSVWPWLNLSHRKNWRSMEAKLHFFFFFFENSEASSSYILQSLWPQKKWLLSCWWKDSTGSKCLQHWKCDYLHLSQDPFFHPPEVKLSDKLNIFIWMARDYESFKSDSKSDFHLTELTLRDLSILLATFQIYRSSIKLISCQILV